MKSKCFIAFFASTLITSGCSKSTGPDTSQSLSASPESNHNLDQQLQASGVSILKIDGKYGYAIDTTRDPNVQIDLLRKYIHQCEEGAKVATDSVSASDLKERAQEATLALNSLAPGMLGSDGSGVHPSGQQTPGLDALHSELASLEAQLWQLGASFQGNKLMMPAASRATGILTFLIKKYILLATMGLNATSDSSEISRLQDRIQSASSVLGQIYSGTVAGIVPPQPELDDAEKMRQFLENFNVNERIHQSGGGNNSTYTTRYRISIQSKQHTPLINPRLIENLNSISKRYSSDIHCAWKSHSIPLPQSKLYRYELETPDLSQNCLYAAEAQLATYLLAKIKTNRVKVLDDGTLAFSSNARAH